MLLQLYVHGAGGQFFARRVTLNPECCVGDTFRYCADGSQSFFRSEVVPPKASG